MKKHTKPDLFSVLLIVGRIVLGGLFIYASWDKILDPVAFAEIIAGYQILPPKIINAVALGLPWLELVCGACLIINHWTRGSALIVTLLMVLFMGALGFNAYRGMDVTCGCFTLTGQAPTSVWLYLLRDALLLTLATTIFVLPKGHAGVWATFGPKTNQD